jgi:hypothetical protein
MDWTKLPKPRLLAAAYVLALPSWLVGVVVIIYSQATGAEGALFAIGQAIITPLAFALRTPATNPRDAFPRAWNRLNLGLELPTALHLIRKLSSTAGWW